MIDVVSACNLTCPSCPKGNSNTVKNARGIMTPEHLAEILAKASKETIITSVWLFNWTEPLIHPRLPELVEIASAYAPCLLSSNLNLPKVNYDSLLSKEPATFFVSVSGFNQGTYKKSHRGGNIEIVKQNMFRLSLAKARADSKTQLVVLFHRYLDNLEDERQMKEYAQNLGFRFEPRWARLLPIEKNLQYLEDPSQLSREDLDLVARLALPPSRAVLDAVDIDDAGYCPLREKTLVVNSQGQVQLCCIVYDEGRFGIGNYLDEPLDVLLQRKRAHETCQACIKSGIMGLFQFRLDRKCELIAKTNVIDHYTRSARVSSDELRSYLTAEPAG
ncbi:radical SAM protein [Thiohalocapsa marina]|uniref:Radical SAM protein n=2 Tax=Thiohalocapsa marina TaxID=424902 RepID=A0A5M8FUA6_9GAMM|nr:radical SAM protein [Thiohalocapsa marina]KAA6187408.1 radical SAM protein [Thiohalocapsa marina]